ncbi:MAG: hypothetical protein K0U39_00285 [Alphaproteobacteria bacterium]|nr:hypothetical protein [Alphaproteobacteria bacterium]
MHKILKNIFYIIVLSPLLLWVNVCFAQNIYVGAHYHLPFNPIDPLTDNSHIQQQYYADGVAENTALSPYNISGFSAMLGYSGLFYKEFSAEWRISNYDFMPKENSSGRNVTEHGLFIRASAPQMRLSDSIFGAFYVGGGLGKMKNNSGIAHDRPSDYDSRNFIAGFEIYRKLSRFSYTPHRFFIELIDMTAESDPYEQNAIRGSTVKRGEILNSRHILFGYNFDIF